MSDVFISYARADNEEFAKRLYTDLVEAGIDVWWDREAMENRGRTFLQEIRDAIEQTDRLIAVLGPRALVSRYVQAEWGHATLFAKAIIPVLRLGTRESMPQEFQALHGPDMTADEDYKRQLEELVRLIRTPVPRLGPSLTAVPALPPRFQKCTEELSRLFDQVLPDLERPVVVAPSNQTTVIHGMGGIGKSVLAAAFCRSVRARLAFTEGVAWLNIGTNPDLVSKLRVLGQALGDDTSLYLDIETAAAGLSRCLAHKRCLIVLDDVWDSAHIAPFLNALSPQNRLMITTRDAGILIGAKTQQLESMSPKAALELLSDWSGKEVKELPKEAHEVAKACGYLPFALALCGAMNIDPGVSWEDQLGALREADLSYLEHRFPNYKDYETLLKSLHVSIEALEPLAMERYRELAVFHDVETVPQAAVETLWTDTAGLSTRNTHKLLSTLARKALLKIIATEDRHISLHSLQRDYLRAVTPDMVALNRHLLDAYSHRNDGHWWSLANDGYIYDRLIHHLVASGAEHDARQLLLAYQWLQRKLEMCGASEVIRDFDSVPSDPVLQTIADTIRLSFPAIRTDASQFAGQLIARLAQLPDQEIRNLLSDAWRYDEKPWFRPLFATLIPPGSALLRFLSGHRKNIEAVAITRDGSRAVSVANDRRVLIWELPNRADPIPLTDTDTAVSVISIADTGNVAGSIDYGGILTVWDLESFEELGKVEVDSASLGVNALFLMRNGHEALLQYEGAAPILWDVRTVSPIVELQTSDSTVTALAVAEKAGKAVVGANDGRIAQFDLTTGKRERAWAACDCAVTALAVTPTADQIVMAYDYDDKDPYKDEAKGALRHCDLNRAGEFSDLGEAAGGVTHLTISADGRTVVTASEYGQLERWDLQKEVRINVIEREAEVFPAPVAIAADRSWVVSGFAANPNLELWDLYREAIPPDAEMEVTAVAVDRGGDRVMWAELEGRCSVWAIGAEERPRVLETSLAKIDCLSFTPSGRGAVAVEVTTTFLSDDGEVIASTSGTDWVPPDELRDLPSDVADDQKGMAFPYARFRLARFNLDTEGAIEFTDDYIVRGLAQFFGVSSDGARVVFRLNDDLLVWNSKQESDHLLDSSDSEGTAALDTDGKFVLSARTGQPVKIWDAESTAEIQTIAISVEESISALCLTADARFAVMCFAGGKLELRNLKTDDRIATFTADRAFRNCAISADGKTIIAADDANLHSLRLETFGDSI